ncbi:MAG: hypothetical protein F6K18_13370 [Okeania sp. SIO2C2]|nr:hypothetical protein [Okeania sp. SIO2C2]NEP87724.1 hypothetical protein [Okeania sp. SIO2C2]
MYRDSLRHATSCLQTPTNCKHGVDCGSTIIEEGDRRQETGDRRKITWGF